MMRRVLICVFGAGTAFGQLGPAGSSGGAAVAVQLPVSGRTSGNTVTATQSSVPGATSSVNTLNGTVTVQGNFSGSVQGGPPLTGKLTLQDAVDRALAHNLGAIGLAQALRQARGQDKISRSALRPNITGAMRENYFTQNLQALGIKFPGLPAVVGPNAYYDLRATLAMSLVDLTAINNHRATSEIVKANEEALRDARESVVLAAAGGWLQARSMGQAEARLGEFLVAK